MISFGARKIDNIMLTFLEFPHSNNADTLLVVCMTDIKNKGIITKTIFVISLNRLIVGRLIAAINRCQYSVALRVLLRDSISVSSGSGIWVDPLFQKDFFLSQI
jgi:hypothetical protein